MSTWGWIIVAIAIAALCVIAFAAFAVYRRRRSGQLRELFGSEYERTVANLSSRRKAERELSDRQERREELDIHPLPEDARERYADNWQSVQSHFVDDPGGAVRDADRLIEQVMSERGYPMADFERRAADVSVDHPEVVAHYRSAHAAYVRFVNGDASTEDLRRSFVDYRALFDELLAPERQHESVAR